MLTGRDALLSIEQAISRVRTDEGRLDQALRSAMDEAARLRGEEAEGFRLLARVKLDVMVRDNVIGDLDATERRALAMIENHRQALDDLVRRRNEVQAALDKAEAQKHACDQTRADALEALDQQRQRTAERVKSDAAWQAGKSAVEAAEKVAANADSKASLAESDLAAKRQPYEADPLFAYLWRKKHGQAEDRSSPFVRFFDRKVARLIGYQDARANYVMLQEIPARLREHARSKQDDVKAAKAHVAEIERQALVADGIEPVEAQVETADAGVKAGEQQIIKLTAELQAIDAERQKALGSADDVAYSSAVDLLVQGLAREDLRQLYEEAVRTPTPADDQAINSIAAARTACQKADSEVVQIRGEIRETARRRAELEGARDRARGHGYDDPRGTFGSGQDALGQVIGGILGGVLAGGALDHIFRDNYRAPRPRVDPDFGGGWRGPSWPGPLPGSTGDSWGGTQDRGGDDGQWRTGGTF